MRRLWLIFLMLSLATIACSADDVIGQRPLAATPTIPAFSTATPGGRISVFMGTPNAQVVGQAITATPLGNVVGPAATATAAFATLQAATATAGAPRIIPIFQPSQCPDAGAPPVPARPGSFGQFPQAIALYLSAGGVTTTLESTLRSWGAINEGRGVVQSNTDITGDGINEVIVTIFDPSLYRANQLSPGQLLVFGCVQKAFKLLYSTPYSASTMLPELKRVGNMNGGDRAQLAFIQQFCTNGSCLQSMQILNWNSLIGAFEPLNDQLMDATNAKVQISDVDGDGLLEVSITFNPPDNPNDGPYRRITNVWDWNGSNYVLALTQKEAPVYRIHAIYDADAIFQTGDLRTATRTYDKLRDDTTLALWSPNDPYTLRALVSYRKLLILAMQRQSKALEDAANAMIAENPPGSPSDMWGQFAAAFLQAYKDNRQLRKMCTVVQGWIASRPDLLNSINIYGSSNHYYTAAELCPI